MTDNILTMPTPMNVFVERARAALERTKRGAQEEIEGILDFAAVMREARERFPSNQAFGIWLAENDLDHYGHQDRAAAISLAGWAQEARIIMQNTNWRSPQVIWAAIKELQSTMRQFTAPEIQKRVTSVSNTADQTPPVQKTDDIAPTQPLAPLSAPGDTPKTADLPPRPAPRHPVMSGGVRVARHPENAELIRLLDIPVERYTTVLSAYPYNRQTVIKSTFTKLAKNLRARKSARALFERAFKVVESGRAPELSNAMTDFDARIVLPDVPEGFCKHFTALQLAQRVDRLDLLNAKAAEYKAAGMSAYDIHAALHHIWEVGAVKPPPVAKPIELEPEDTKNRIRHTVKYCGEVIWPDPSLKHVTYQDLNMGWHIADQWLKHLEVATPAKPNELLVQVMHLIQDLRAASSLTGVTDVMMTCVQAYARRNLRRDKADLSDGIPPGLPR